jgi:hypothetical protein
MEAADSTAYIRSVERTRVRYFANPRSVMLENGRIWVEERCLSERSAST